MPIVTVIIPVYNVEKYLPACLDSVLGQSLTDTEVICIDDASPDGSGEILDEYALRDSRVKVIHLKENHMQGYGRNLGLKLAEGKYVYFLDSDDMIEPVALEKMVRIMEKDSLDGLYFDSSTLFESESLRKKHSGYPEGRSGSYEDRVYNGIELLNCFALQKDWIVYVQRQFWNREFLLEHEIFSPEGRTEHEDEYFSFAAICHARRVRYVPERWFIHRYRENSVMTRQAHPKDFHGYFVNFCMAGELADQFGFAGPGVEQHIAHMYDRADFFYPIFQNEDPENWFEDPRYLLQYRFYNRERLCREMLAEKEIAFWSDLHRYAGIHIYGAGKIAQAVARRLERIDIRVFDFIVSENGNNPDSIGGIRVIPVKEANVRENEIVLVAMSRGYADEIRKITKQYGFIHFWYAGNILDGPFTPEGILIEESADDRT